MRFTAQGSKLVCSRIVKTTEGDPRFRRVVEFDAQIAVRTPGDSLISRRKLLGGES
ncbi:MAG: hypothetical protein KJO82_09405 [Gammaproteobacteria bacterium]|nr:hypothetical protein [Gammaproteobacteria bacterium]